MNWYKSFDIMIFEREHMRIEQMKRNFAIQSEHLTLVAHRTRYCKRIQTLSICRRSDVFNMTDSITNECLEVWRLASICPDDVDALPPSEYREPLALVSSTQ